MTSDSGVPRTPPRSGPPAAFLGSTSGLGRQRLRARRYTRLSRDVYVLAEHADQLAVRCRALLMAVPDAVVSHTTAAQLHRLPVRSSGAVHLTRPTGAAPVRRSGVVPHVAALLPENVVLLAGVRTTSLVRTFLDLAPSLTLVDLVCVGDVVSRRSSLSALQEEVAASAPRRGLVRARAAAALSDPGADSPAETRLRLVLHAAGLRGLRHGVEVLDDGGGWISTPDLADREARVAVQYDGLVHFEKGPARWRHDIDRDELTRAAGWEVVVLVSQDLRSPEAAVAKVRAAYRRAGQRRHG